MGEDVIPRTAMLRSSSAVGMISSQRAEKLEMRNQPTADLDDISAYRSVCKGLPVKGVFVRRPCGWMVPSDGATLPATEACGQQSLEHRGWYPD